MNFQQLDDLEFKRLIGLRIRGARMRAGLRPLEVVAISKLSKTLYYDCEVGGRAYTLLTLRRISVALNYSLSNLVVSPEEDARLRASASLPDQLSQFSELFSTLLSSIDGLHHDESLSPLIERLVVALAEVRATAASASPDSLPVDDPTL